MNRRNFLSWLGLGAIAACVPAPIKALVARVVPKRWVGPIVVDQSGRGDFVDLQSAIDALPPEGGSIFVRAGVYLWPNFGDKSVRVVGEEPKKPIRINGCAPPPELNSGRFHI